MRLIKIFFLMVLFVEIQLGAQNVTIGTQIRLGINAKGPFPKEYTIKAIIGCSYEITDISSYLKLRKSGESVTITPNDKDQLFSYESDKKYTFIIKKGKLVNKNQNKIIFNLPIKFVSKTEGQTSSIWFPVELEVSKSGKIIEKRNSTFGMSPVTYETNQAKNIEQCFKIEHTGWASGRQSPLILIGVGRCDGKDILTRIEQ